VPRLTNDDYTKQRLFLVHAWSWFPDIFTVLPYNQQMEVHEYYAPSKTCTTDEALVHRHQVTREQPSLPNRAGKSFPRLLHRTQVITQRIEFLATHPQPPLPHLKTKSRTHGNVRSYALTPPEIDDRKLARALPAVARDMQTKHDDRGGEGEAA